MAAVNCGPAGSDQRAVSASGRAWACTAQFHSGHESQSGLAWAAFYALPRAHRLSMDNQSTPRETIELLKAAMATCARPHRA